MMGITAEQKDRMERKKKEALAKLASKKKGGKTTAKVASRSMLSFFTPIGKKKPAETASTHQDASPTATLPAQSVPIPRAPMEVPSSAPLKAKVEPQKPQPKQMAVAAPRRAGNEEQKKKLFTSPATQTPPTATPTSVSPSGKSTSASSGGRRRASVLASYAENSDSEEDSEDEAAPVAKKKTFKRLKRAALVDSDSDEYAPDEDAVAQVKMDEKVEMEVDSGSASSDDNAEALRLLGSDDDDDKPVRMPAKKRAKPSAASPANNVKSKLNSFAAQPNKVPAGNWLQRAGGASSSVSGSPSAKSAGSKSAVTPTQQRTQEQDEQQYPWLKNITDANRNPPNHPDYDPSTLYVPNNPKRVIRGVTKPLTDFELQYWNIKKTCYDTILFFKKGKFYELYGKDAYIGNKEMDLKITDRVNMPMVGVPEKTFSMWATKFLGLGYKVARVDEVESQLAKGMREKKSGGASAKKIISRNLTAVYTQGTLSGEFLSDDAANYIMSIKEGPNKMFGICFCDVGTAEISISVFQDDAALTQLETILVQIKPKELVVEKGGLTQPTQRLLKQHTAAACTNRLAPESEFWSAERTLDEVEKESYFETMPDVLQELFDNKSEEPVSAFGGLMSYFRTLLLDQKIISQGRFNKYDPLEHGGTLMLDGQTLQNLEILENNVDGGRSGTLLELLCHCQSPFGKRQFRRWLCHPLRGSEAINARYDAIDELDDMAVFKEELIDLLKSLPDIERAVAEIHVGNCKPETFVKTLEGLTKVAQVFESLSSSIGNLRSARLRQLFNVEIVEDLEEKIESFRKKFDWSKAKTEGKILPSRGADEQYDEIGDTLGALEKKFNRLLRDYRQQFRLPKLEFWHNSVSHEGFQVPIPANNKVQPDSSWMKMSSTKSVNRYWSPEIAQDMTQVIEGRETQRQILEEFFGNLQQEFDADLKLWTSVVKTLAEIDCHVSLVLAKANMGGPMCRPEVLSNGSKGVFEVVEMRHPCLVSSGSVTDYIPNSTTLGGSSASTIVLTGPNMGGKSTLLRQTCVAVIMAQLGAYVPAECCRLSPVDRIFTRIGANDNILAGRSTFMVELKETATILNMATSDSLVILDELGRGTSTFDGTAIAQATLSYMLENIGCRSLFATHYHSLTDEFADDDRVSLQHMGCAVDENSRDVTFLYKLTPGVCSKSYGLNVAAMAGIPSMIIDVAELQAKSFEQLSRQGASAKRSAFLNLMRSLEHGTAAASRIDSCLSVLQQ